MNERERVEHYLAWRKAKGKDRRGRLYRRLRVAGTGVTLAVLVITLGAAVAGWPRLAKRDIVRPAAPPSGFASRSELGRPALGSTAPMVPEDGDARSSSATAVTPARSTTSPRVAAGARSLPPRKSTAPPELPPVARVSTGPAAPSGDPNASMRTTGSPTLGESAALLTQETNDPVVTARVDEPPVPPTTRQPDVPAAPLPASGPTLPSGSPAPTSPNASVASPRNETAAAPTALSPPAPGPRPPVERIERLKHLAGYIPEVWLARHIARWARQRPADEPGAAPLQGSEPQSR